MKDKPILLANHPTLTEEIKPGKKLLFWKSDFAPTLIPPPCSWLQIIMQTKTQTSVKSDDPGQKK